MLEAIASTGTGLSSARNPLHLEMLRDGISIPQRLASEGSNIHNELNPMTYRELQDLLPRNKEDSERANYLSSLDYETIRPVVYPMLQWLRTYPSPVAEAFIEFFVKNGDFAKAEVCEAFIHKQQSHWRFVMVTHIMPNWSREAVETQRVPLGQMVTCSGEPEIALMAIRLLAMHDLAEREWLTGWLSFISERLERNLEDAKEIECQYFL